MQKRMLVIGSATQAIEALDGTVEVGKLFDPPLDYRVVHNWKRRGLPPDSYYVLAPALVRKHCSFSPLLFGQKMPASSASRRRRLSKLEQSLSI